MIMGAAEALKLTNPLAIVEAAAKAENTIKSLQKEIGVLMSKLSASQLGDLVKNSTDVNGVTVVTGNIKGAGADALRDICEKAKSEYPGIVIVVAAANGGKVTFAAACGKEALSKKVNAGKIVKAVAQAAGGNGGGKPDMAMAGAKDESKIDYALSTVKSVVEEMTGA